MQEIADELRRQFDDRLAHLKSYLDDLYEQFPPVEERARLALRLYELYCEAAREALSEDWDHAVDATDRIDLLRFLLRDLKERAEELEEFFAGALYDAVPPGLVDAVETELTELLHTPRQVILSVGPADNYETVIAELQDFVFAALGPHAPDLPPELAQARFALLRLPRLESSQPSWRPLILGHEVAHLGVLERSTLAARRPSVPNCSPISPNCGHGRHIDCQGCTSDLQRGWPNTTVCACRCHCPHNDPLRAVDQGSHSDSNADNPHP